MTITDVGDAGLRDKLDLQWRAGVTGLYSQADPSALVDITRCPLGTPGIERLLTMWRADPPPVDRAAVRLRSASDGTLGLWLDLPHVAVKALLDERAWLAGWVARAAVELGPKAREVKFVDDLPTLGSAVMRPWTSTWVDEREVPISTRIADFTQPSRRGNRALVAAVMAHIRTTGATRVLELGAGAGNLTVPLQVRRRVRAVELDTVALSRNLGPASTVELVATSFTRAADIGAMVFGMDAILADPPRSGLGAFAAGLAQLSPSLRPRDLVYVSCHVEALARDAASLALAGYRVAAVDGIDQFPHTPHTEWVVRFSR